MVKSPFDPIWEWDSSRLRDEVKSMISGVCESGVCTSFSVLEVPVVLESNFSFRTQVVGGVLA